MGSIFSYSVDRSVHTPVDDASRVIPPIERRLTKARAVAYICVLGRSSPASVWVAGVAGGVRLRPVDLANLVDRPAERNVSSSGCSYLGPSTSAGRCGWDKRYLHVIIPGGD